MTVDISTIGFDLLKGGDLFNSMLAGFTQMGIQAGFIYMMIIAFVGTMMYMRTKNFGFIGVFLILMGGGGAFGVAGPEFSKYFFGVILIGGAMSLYEVFKGGYDR